MRRNIYNVFMTILLTMVNTRALAQDSTSIAYSFGDGLAIHGGVGFLSLKDEYISSEVYSGEVSYFAASWSRQNETYGHRLWLEYEYTAALRNHNISTEITQLRLGVAFMYPIGKTNVLSKDVDVLFGPTSELFFHFRSENIANGGESIANAYSFALLFSGGVKLEALCSLNESLQLHAKAQTSLLSLGGRTPSVVAAEEGEKTESPFKLLTVFAGFDASGEIGCDYKLYQSVLIAADYRFELTRISAWDFFISGNDNFILSAAYDL